MGEPMMKPDPQDTRAIEEGYGTTKADVEKYQLVAPDGPPLPRHLPGASVSDAFRKTDRRVGPHPRRKLIADQVAEIRRSGEPGPVLAARYGVSHVTIWKIRHRISYRDLPGEPAADATPHAQGK
jgi:hypothetical protein